MTKFLLPDITIDGQRLVSLELAVEHPMIIDLFTGEKAQVFLDTARNLHVRIPGAYKPMCVPYLTWKRMRRKGTSIILRKEEKQIV